MVRPGDGLETIVYIVHSAHLNFFGTYVWKDAFLSEAGEAGYSPAPVSRDSALFPTRFELILDLNKGRER